MNKCYNVGLYLRLSVEDKLNSSKRGKINVLEKDSESIANQRQLLTEYVDLQGWNMVRVYSDDGYSGGMFDNRPAFQQMVKDAEAGLINLILVKDLSRFGRDYIETGRYTDEVFPSLGVRFIALMDNIDSESNCDLLPFRSILNDYHLKDLSRKVKSVMKAKAEKGEYIGAWAPYGFMKDPKNKNRLLIDEYAAEIVRKIFNMRIQGFGLQKITAFLNNEGILSPRSYYYQKVGKEYKPKNWTVCVIGDIINNEAYIGHSVKFKTGYLSYKNRQVINKPAEEWIRCENVFPKIISSETWETVRRFDTAVRRPKGATAAVSLFHGLIRCADCGSSMIHKKSTSTSRVTGEKRIGHAYICSKHEYSGYAVCSRHTIRESVLLTIIRGDIQKQLESVSINESRIAKEIQQKFNGDSLDDSKRHLEVLAARLEELSSAARKLYEERFKSIIDINTFKSLFKKVEEDKIVVKSEYNELSELISSEERRIIEFDNIIPKLRKFLSLETITHEMLSELIKCIIVSESDGLSINREHNVRIIYRFETLV